MTEPDPDGLRRLLDIEEIKGLKARYFRCMDRKPLCCQTFYTSNRSSLAASRCQAR